MISEDSLNKENSPPEIKAGMTINSLFTHLSLDPLEWRILLEYAIGFSRIQLITDSDHVLTDQEARVLSSVVARRMIGEPIAYLVGEREFYGLPFHVTPDVLIPRPETELLVDLALEIVPENGSMLDLGTGSGAIAVAVAHMRPDVEVTATDLSLNALSVARINAKNNLKQDQTIQFKQGSWYEAVNAQDRFDLIVSNPPYIDVLDDHLKKGDLRFEPLDALTDHADGLTALRLLASGASTFLKSGGYLLMEHGYDQSLAVRMLLQGSGFQSIQSWTDLAGIERVSGGRFVK